MIIVLLLSVIVAFTAGWVYAHATVAKERKKDWASFMWGKRFLSAPEFPPLNPTQM